MKKRFLAILLCLCMVFALLPTTVQAAGTSRPTTTTVSIKCVYNGGNSQVYVNRATGSGGAAGWNIQYIYSSNILNSNAVFANLKAALNEPYAAMVPAVANENATVGLAVGNYGTPTDDWRSAEWVARNVIPGGVTAVTTGDSGAVNATNIAAIQTSGQRFVAEETVQEAAHYAAWQASEAQNEIAFEAAQDQAEQLWDAQEQAKKDGDPEYTMIPYDRETYNGSTYRALDFTNAVITDARTLAANQFETAVGSALSGPFYTIENGAIIETYHVQMLMHVTTVYTQSANKETAIAPLPMPYQFIQGQNGKWAKGSTGELCFTADAEYSKFLNGGSVAVDGTVIANNQYGTAFGSTVVTLKASYLETLAVGRHTLRVNFTDGYAETIFTISGDAAGLPKTGDNALPILWLGIMLLAGMGLAASLLVRRKRQNG